jgi:hypothetical protein
VYQWDAGSVTIEVGVDIGGDGGEMAESDYRVMGTWRIEKVERDDDNFTLTLKEPKSKLDAKIPFELYTRDEFPYIDADSVGKPIPIAYGKLFGRKPVVINRSAKQFKVATHRIASFDEVRIQKDTEEIRETEAVPTWTIYKAGPVYTGDVSQEVQNVTFNGTDLTKKNSLASVVSTVGTWFKEGEILYVQPPSGETITSGTWSVIIKNTVTSFVRSSFATVNLDDATFTLGDDWDKSAEVSVDFSGRIKPDGQLMTNGADMVADLLDYLGEKSFDNESFNESRRMLHIGFDRYGNEKNHLAPSIYLDEANAAEEAFQIINKTVGAFLFSDFEGVWRFNVFRPRRRADIEFREGSLIREFTDSEIRGWQRIVDSRENFARVQLSYAERKQEDWREFVTAENTRNKLLHNLADLPFEERDAPLSNVNDARYYAQRLLTTEAEPLTKYGFDTPWLGFFLLPGDQIRVSRTRGNFDTILEVLEVNYDLIAKHVSIIAGHRRAWGDSFGFWTIEDASNPTVPLDSALWLKSEGLATINGQPVDLWPDLSGNSRNFVQSTLTSARPKFRTNQINGLPAVRFDTSLFSSGMYLDTASFADAFTAAEIFAVVKMDADPPTSSGSGLFNFSSPGLSQLIATDGTVKETFGTSAQKNTAINPAPSFTSWRCYNVISASGEFTINIDGTQIYTTAVNTVQFNGGSSRYSIGGLFATSNPFIGDITEIIMFPRKLTTAERSSVVDYLSNRFALGIGTPAAALPVWSDGWTDAQAAEAKQNHGYWQGASKQASDTDARSHLAGRWW